jgi:hypothetical protein
MDIEKDENQKERESRKITEGNEKEARECPRQRIYKITHPPQHPFSCDPEGCSFGRPPAGPALAFPGATAA